MKDILPAEMEIRDYVTSVIKDTYRSFQFTPIELPCMENIANLTEKTGPGENEADLQGNEERRKLNLETAKEKNRITVDFWNALRPCAVPLSRYYSNNANNLPSPFKALQMGGVWRNWTDLREAATDSLHSVIYRYSGEPSNLAEIELITATSTTIQQTRLRELWDRRINERRILKAMAAYSGFAEEDYDSVFITLDKMDKIEVEGVTEWACTGWLQENIDKYLDLFKLLEQTKGCRWGV